MSTHYRLATAFFVIGAVVAIANAVAFRAFPDTWGGPNIGGGVIQLLAYASMLVGVILFIIGTVQRRRNARR